MTDRERLFAPYFQRLVQGSLEPEARVGWAVDLLEAGEDGTDLRILAGLDPTQDRQEIAGCFTRAVEELSPPCPDGAEVGIGIARMVARTALRREIPERDALDAIHRLAVTPLDHPGVLQPWCDLWSGFRRDGGNRVSWIPEDGLEEEVRALAVRFVSEPMEDQVRRLEHR
jgi:hypothetical protein